MTNHTAYPMAKPVAYDRLVHSDWSVSAGKRWTAIAHRSLQGWSIDRLAQTPPAPACLDLLFAVPRTLAGFDFPIGLPAMVMDRIGGDFCQFLSSPLSDRAQRFLTPVETLRDISPAQPFYRRHPAGGRQADLLRGLGCADFNALLRACEMKTATRSRAESIFWTVGAKQVGKAALSGWHDVVIPARARRPALAVRWAVVAARVGCAHIGGNLSGRGLSTSRHEPDREEAHAGRTAGRRRRAAVLGFAASCDVALRNRRVDKERLRRTGRWGRCIRRDHGTLRHDRGRGRTSRGGAGRDGVLGTA